MHNSMRPLQAVISNTIISSRFYSLLRTSEVTARLATIAAMKTDDSVVTYPAARKITYSIPRIRNPECPVYHAPSVDNID